MKRFVFILMWTCWFGYVQMSCSSAEENLPMSGTMVIDGKQYNFYGEDAESIQGFLRESARKNQEEFFYLHVAGRFPDGKTEATKGWRIYRSSLSWHGGTSRSIVLQRESEKERVIQMPLYDLAYGNTGFVDKEAVVINYFPHDKLREIPESKLSEEKSPPKPRGFVYGKRFFAIEQGKVPGDVMPPVFCIADIQAVFSIGNLGLLISSNYSDYKDPYSNEEIFSKPMLPLEIAIATYKYLKMPFPAADKIENPEIKIFDHFTSEKSEMKAGEEVKLSIAYSKDVKDLDWVRLRSDSGGEFRRDKNDVYYKATKPGKQILTLESISGEPSDSSKYEVKFGEQLRIEIKVTGQPLPEEAALAPESTPKKLNN